MTFQGLMHTRRLKMWVKKYKLKMCCNSKRGAWWNEDKGEGNTSGPGLSGRQRAKIRHAHISQRRPSKWWWPFQPLKVFRYVLWMWLILTYKENPLKGKAGRGIWKLKKTVYKILLESSIITRIFLVWLLFLLIIFGLTSKFLGKPVTMALNSCLTQQ